MSNDTEKEAKIKGKLDEDTLSYFKRVESVIEDDDFEDEEARELFIENVFTQIEGNELGLCCGQSMSRVFERLIVLFNEAQLKAIWKNLSKDYMTVTTDRFGSHVVQNLVNSIPRIIRIERNKLKGEKHIENSEESMEQLFILYCSFIRENLPNLLGDTYGSHVIRAVLEVLGGVHIIDSVQRSRNSRGCRGKAFKMKERKYGKVQPAGHVFGSPSSQKFAVPESFTSVLENLTASVLNMDINTLVYSPLSCPVLQTLLLVQHEKDDKLCSKLCKKIMKLVVDNQDNEESYQIPSLLTDSVASHLVEKVFLVASSKQHKTFFKKFFKGHLDSLALHPVCNYLVQHLLTNTTDPVLGGLMLDELLGEIEEILSSGHDGVVARMAEMSVRFQVKQQEFQEGILEAFHCAGKKERKKCAPLILCMTTYDVFFGEKNREENTEKKEEGTDKTKDEEVQSPSLKAINYHGAVLLKTVLDFQNPKVFVSSLLHMKKEELTKVCCDLIGSRTIEALLKSQTVPIEKKNKLCKIFQGEFAAFACDKSASHVVESCWREVDAVHREIITQELTNQQHKLSKDFYGSKVLKSCVVQKTGKNTFGKEESNSRKRQNVEEVLKDKQEKRTKTIQKDESNFTQYVKELAVLGFEQTNQEDVRNESRKKSKKEKKRKKEKAMEDEIDLIFKSKKTAAS